MKNPLVLIVEDEPALADILADNLQAEGYETITVGDGETAIEKWQAKDPALVVLDVMLPNLNGYEVCRRMRVLGFETPVLYLSAKGELTDRLTGLEAGGDDYLPKPFDLTEFLLRVQALLKRRTWLPPTPPTTRYRFGKFIVDYQAMTVQAGSDAAVPIGEKELLMFQLFAERPGQAIHRNEILDAVWGDNQFPSTRTVDNFVVRLRKIFEDNPANPVYFHTVWGVGYKFTPDLTS